MNDIVNDKKGHNIVNDKITALLISQKAYFSSISVNSDGFYNSGLWENMVESINNILKYK